MGTYLSTPIVDKGIESGECLDDEISPLSWGLVDMQGWRKSMEDAHVADTSVKIPPHLLPPSSDQKLHFGKVFGVFDGHGGAEVARFCQLYLVDVLMQQKCWQGKTQVNSESRDPAFSPVGASLIDSFHALDRMIDDISRRDELIRLRTEKPQHGEKRTLDKNAIPSIAPLQRPEPVGTQTSLATENPNENGNSIKPESTKKTEMEGNECSELDKDAVMKEKDEDSSDEDTTTAVGKEEASEEDREDDEVEKSIENPVSAPPPAAASVAILPTIIQNGRQICNLPDHPIHAGCTAIVAVLIGRTLTIANAGDSRAVLCRDGGRTEALSFDHKPQQEREMTRIAKAGGFVNQFGRVNGNLNLSRSIGDLKYKQVPGLNPAEQMITAEPDIAQVTLHLKDEFIILGCDGIWDCLSNEQAVEYVRDRIDTKTTIEIGTEMLDEIISDDPRATQGIGGDNMTVMIIDLQPSTLLIAELPYDRHHEW
eukprot:CAMPEP_0194201348 /NCGR_PEP_ID=MMETSP0156-20130528/1632_1 /TAXON_ID=33649 /ORGANISM="Thalassionema nitzschioides, Strain L26-B" /LENGTH=481 /DNA_ID=CAMNT_0038926517 /DNA_START=179 /DNA_END=1622 /DNA_ORIENTATION=+